jgi:hypothetical protein
LSQILFYALKADIAAILGAVEQSIELTYSLTGVFEPDGVQTVASWKDVSWLGEANDSQSIGCDSLLVLERDTPLRLRRIGLRTAVDQLANPDSVTLTPAGRYDERTVLHGRVATAYSSTKTARLMRAYRKAFRSRFTKIGAFYVGEEAERILMSGGRLTMAVQSPPEYDLKPT